MAQAMKGTGDGSARVERDVRLAYDTWSGTYDSQPNATRDLSTYVVRRLVPDPVGLTVVEAGCGTGVNSSWLAPRCERLIGLDSSPGMLAIARAKANQPHVRFVRHDIREPWLLKEASAGLVLINLVLEHIESLAPVLRGASRVMHEGATLIISELHPNRVAAGARARIRSEGLEIVNFLHTVGDYVAAARKSGLRPVSIGEWSKQVLDDTLVDTDDDPLILSLCFEKDSAG
ncbi:MAG: class I SAM-dependent methyltransferase [Anaerolineales bacterium]|nr:MAG: class I SAM-dependent methyltransferase [Anaerolineales bacterium]